MTNPTTYINENQYIRLVMYKCHVVFKADPNLLTRKRHNVWARMAFYSELRKRGYSFSDIGEFFGLDHATVINGIRRHEQYYKRDAKYTFLHNIFLKELGHDVGETEVIPVPYAEFSNGQTALINLIKTIPDELCEGIYVKLEAIVKMSKVVHRIK